MNETSTILPDDVGAVIGVTLRASAMLSLLDRLKNYW